MFVLLPRKELEPLSQAPRPAYSLLEDFATLSEVRSHDFHAGRTDLGLLLAIVKPPLGAVSLGPSGGMGAAAQLLYVKSLHDFAFCFIHSPALTYRRGIWRAEFELGLVQSNSDSAFTSYLPKRLPSSQSVTLVDA